MTEEIFEDPVNDETHDSADCVEDAMHNDTNDDNLLYFARVSNHYLRLAKSSSEFKQSVRHHMEFPIIADSGANFHMFREKEFFETLSSTTGTVILSDGKTSLPILGVGKVKCYIGDHVLRIDNVRYVPDLSESIYSLFQHVQLPAHAIQSSFEDGLYIIFPEFRTRAIIGDHDIYLDAVPCRSSEHSYLQKDIIKQSTISSSLYKPFNRISALKQPTWIIFYISYVNIILILKQNVN
jgi:hypothetical protein